MREKCFLHHRPAPRRKPLRGAGRSTPCGRTTRPDGRPTAWRPARPAGENGNALRADRTPQSRSRTKQRGGGKSCTSIKTRLDRGAGVRSPCAFAHVSPACLLLLWLWLGLWSLSLPLPDSGSAGVSGPRRGPRDREASMGQSGHGPPTLWAKAQVDLWAHTTHRCACVPSRARLSFEPPTARFSLVGAIPVQPAPRLALSRLRLIGHVPL